MRRLTQEFVQFGFVASWQFFRNAVREKHFFLVNDENLSKDFMSTSCSSARDSGSVWKQSVDFSNQLIGDELSDLRMRVPPHTTSQARPPRRLASRLASSICQEGEGTGVMSSVM
jgi:hypothetical protein